MEKTPKRRSQLRNCLLRTAWLGSARLATAAGSAAATAAAAAATDGSGSVGSAARGTERNQNSWHLARVFTIKVPWWPCACCCCRCRCGNEPGRQAGRQASKQASSDSYGQSSQRGLGWILAIFSHPPEAAAATAARLRSKRIPQKHTKIQSHRNTSDATRRTDRPVGQSVGRRPNSDGPSKLPTRRQRWVDLFNRITSFQRVDMFDPSDFNFLTNGSTHQF